MYNAKYNMSKTIYTYILKEIQINNTGALDKSKSFFDNVRRL